jgi:hypothetical protein
MKEVHMNMGSETHLSELQPTFPFRNFRHGIHHTFTASRLYSDCIFHSKCSKCLFGNCCYGNFRGVGTWSPYCCYLHTYKGDVCLPFLGMSKHSFPLNTCAMPPLLPPLPGIITGVEGKQWKQGAVPKIPESKREL